jgi:DNA polymerase-3 subunit gamma/tau
MSSSQIEREAPTAKKSEPAPSAELGEFRLETATWPQSFGSLGLTGILENVASHCQCVSVTADSAEFVLCRENASLFNPSHVEKLTAALAHAEGCKRTVSIEIGEVKETPAKWIAERRALALEEAKRRMQADEVVIALSQHLDGELMLDSIKPGGIRV